MGIAKALLIILACRSCACGNVSDEDEKSKAYLTFEHKLVGVSLEISGRIDKNIFKVHNGSYCGISYRTYTTRSGYELTEVCDSGVIIWSSQGPGNSCLFARVTFKGCMRSYLRLYVRLQDGTYKMNTYKWEDSRWKIRNGTLYESSEDKSKVNAGKNARIRHSRLLRGSRGIMLDLTISNEAVSMSESKFRGVTTVLYTVAPGHFFTSIIDATSPIWDGRPGEICTIAKTHSDFNTKLLKIHVKNQASLEDQYYDRNQCGEWTRIEKPTFEAKVDEMKIRGQITPQPDLLCYEQLDDSV
ncbi:signal peptide containing protein [Theileria equi strain WA]|uniref:Signal peptide containing protein n=1 Tax=Theileria equi strain WA TaxID=1537102 RepID=L1LFU8_THEEQ|nr:signal peptide containing protein [Theileria equi strain WA]EKX74149.1 signal peptide containing protein [Theileria equi strain WA]|eukprot:XP_004833601.1 signal peptide containing protein [Theileria equi strain WA]